MKMNYKKGFTLIELLVVVAIIGILASVVLTSLNSARNKGKDASAKASMSSMRAQAELSADGGSYEGICASLSTLKTAVENQVPGSVTCHDGTSTSWSAIVTLNDSTQYCVDSSGYAGTASAASDTGCTP